MNSLRHPKKKVRILEFLVSTMQQHSYDKHDLDAFIRSNLSSDLLNTPIYAADHLRSALIEFGFMDRDPYKDIYTLKEGTRSLSERHEVHTQNLLEKIDNAPDEKVDCPFCDYQARPSAMLNHYDKKHSMEKYYQSLREECLPNYLL